MRKCVKGPFGWGAIDEKKRVVVVVVGVMTVAIRKKEGADFVS